MPAKIAHTPMMKRILKTADPTIVPTPTSDFDINTPEIDIKVLRVMDTFAGEATLT